MARVEMLEPLLASFLPKQRWYSGRETPRSVKVRHRHHVRPGWPLLIELLVEADGALYQVPVGMRAATEGIEFLHGHDDALLGEVQIDHDGAPSVALAYDAAFDSELALLLLSSTGVEPAERVRLMGAEQSNTSLVFDEKVILKIFRRVQPGPNPEVEVTQALTDAGFQWVAAPLATKEFDDGGTVYHLAVVQPYLYGGVEGWAMALTSLRDLFGVHDTQSIPILRPGAEPPEETDPAEAGGDFSADASRLGETTAELHASMVEAFGSTPGDAVAWASSIQVQLDTAVAGDGDAFDVDAAQRIVDRLRSLDDAGIATRIHGDFHLGQVMRTDAGWYILDFEGEPARPLEERRLFYSPLRDVAGMLRSFQYAASVACAERGQSVESLTSAWEERNRQAFLDGYIGVASKCGILPSAPDATGTLVDVFELEKALYELRYERAHRPEWEGIPKVGLHRLLAGR